MGIFGAVARYDLDDNDPYIQNATGAVTIVSGLSFSMLVSLVLVPCVYRLLGRGTAA